MLVSKGIAFGLGFNLKPVFDEKSLESLTLKNSVKNNSPMQEITQPQFGLIISKKISLNDIRARILRIPSEIEKEIPKTTTKLSIIVNDKNYILNINSDRTYLGGVTKLYKDEGLILENNLYKSKTAIWNYSTEKIIIEIKGEND